MDEVKEELKEIEKSPLFRQAPKLRRLLEYVCDKALLREGDSISEYTIALDVFGKPPNFKESKDSSVRVEIYRLRRRLAEFYQTEGCNRPIRIVIPQGRYAPAFVSAIAAITDTAIVTDAAIAEDAAKPPRPATPRSTWLVPVMIAALLGAGFTAFWLSRSREAAKSSTTPAPVNLRTAVTPIALPGIGAAEPVRIMAGYSGEPHRDPSGNVWGPDRFFSGGRPTYHAIPAVGRTNDSLRFQNARIGDCTYHIPLRPGVYELHLYFVEPEFGPAVGRGENDRTFFLHINDSRLTPAIDIESDAMGPNIADERVFKGVSPSADGKLHLSLESATGVPLISAIEVLPGSSNTQLPVRLTTHRVSFTDHSGQVWQADNYFLNGQTCPRDTVTTGTPDPALFTVERYGHFDYSIPVDVRGLYTVVLHFAELYFGSTSTGGGGGAGNRVFNVTCNGVLLFGNLDIFGEVGFAHALTKTAYHLKPSAQGKLKLTFEPVANYSVISGIEVLDESR